MYMRRILSRIYNFINIACMCVCRILSEARGLGQLPALNGSTRLRTLRADRARLTHLPRDLCDHAPQLRALLVSLVLTSDEMLITALAPLCTYFDTLHIDGTCRRITMLHGISSPE